MSFLFILSACSDVFEEISPQKTRTVRPVNVADIPQAIQHLNTTLGNNRDVIRSSANNGQVTDLNIDWSQIMEVVDTLGQTNYTVALKDTANAPYVFHNLVIGKTADGHFKKPYVVSYTMSEAFREEYDRTQSIADFEGQVTIQYLSSSVLNHKEGSANLSNQSSVSNTNDPCPNQTITVNAGGGGGGNNSDGNPPNVDDNTGQMCIYYWIDYEDSSGEHTGSNEFSISATQSILYIDCFNIGSTASGTQPCDEQAEFAVIDPFNIIKLTPEAYGDDESQPLCNENLKKLPSSIITSDGTKVDIKFGFTSDGIYSNQPVAPSMHEMLIFALNTANSNLSTDQKIHEVFISSTNNGLHNSNSNHYRNKAIDISRINGVRMTHMNASQLAAAYALQEAFENHSNIRENFGPKFNHKNGQDYTVNTHRDHIHVSSNDCN